MVSLEDLKTMDLPNITVHMMLLMQFQTEEIFRQKLRYKLTLSL